MGARHGVFIQEEATKIYTMVEVDSALPVIVGTAPVQTLPDDVTKPVNDMRLIFSMPQFIQQFGALPEGANLEDYTLYHAAQVYLEKYQVAPIVCINVFDPTKHISEGEDGKKPDVSKVTSTDIIGGTDGTTMKRTGLEMVSLVFHKFNMVPAQILAPGFSGNPAVALQLSIKTQNISGHFSALAPIDIPAEVKNYTEVPTWLKDNNLKSETLIPFFGKGLTNGVTEWGSVHLAGAMARRDADNEGIPFWSPSNSPMLANALIHNDEEIMLDGTEAGWLNSQGCVTGFNFRGGLMMWGNYTAAYPDNNDVKDYFIPIRRMFSFVGNTLVLSTWRMIDSPIVRTRHVESIVESTNLWLNGLVRREKLIAGKVSFLAGDNPTTDIMAGKVRYRTALTPASPAQEIVHILHYDHKALTTLFDISQGA